MEPAFFPECCIYRVPRRLRQIKPEAYTPKLISIGPLHYRKQELMDTEMLKLRYSNEFCYRARTNPPDILRIIMDNEQSIRRCYEESFNISGGDFVRMVFLDSAFIIQHLLMATTGGDEQYKNRYIYSKPWLNSLILLDLMLLENQLPFFILEEIYNKVWSKENNDISFFDLACKYFKKYLPFHDEEKKPTVEKVEHFTDLIRCFYKPSNNHKFGVTISYVYSATKLYESGVRFKMTENRRFDNIEFQKWEPCGNCQCFNFSWLLDFLPCLKCFPCSERIQSLLSLPSFVANNGNEDLFRNLMALEQCHYPLEAYICNYVVLLDQLVNTIEDVELLVDKGIIVNELGSYDVVATMINKLALEIKEENSCYSELAQELKDHFENGCNRNMGYLKSTYFSNLWRGTATVVGLIILGFTLWDFVRSTIK
ncbi:UPF0481 protein At3g47200-like [Quercus robur]|uniref:UPF0481 protein At3g47200-like n=1 Tax=Quercus robur TaxID=38942 RepID=UPI00216358B6|nr:UPF0481 protein At3g47200-like [Quercus robur]